MLKFFIDWLVYSLFKLPHESRLVEVVDYFLYDSIKILFLAAAMIAIVGVLRTYIPQQKINAWLSKKGWAANFMAAFFGAVTPFCSCSSIPLFFGFLRMGVPLGATFSFLITSPLINEYLVVMMLAFFGWKIAIAYVVSGMALGIIAGRVLGRMNLEKYISPDMLGKPAASCCIQEPVEHYANFRQRLMFGASEAKDILQRIWLWVLAGVALGAAVHNYVPDEMIHNLISKTGPFSVVIATLIGVPLYANCVAILPVALVLFQKGIPLGTALAFMMATAALSLPEAILLKRAMRLRLVVIFFAVTALGIIFTGYLFNFLAPVLVHK